MSWGIPSWGQFSGGVLRALGYQYDDAPTQAPQIGASQAPGTPTMEPMVSLAAYAEFPWVRACVDAIAEDLSGLPLRLVSGEGPTAKVIENHPVLDLFRQPTTTLDRVQWERQLITYWLPVGQAFVLLVGGARPTSLVLLHPEQVRPVADTFGQLEGIKFQAPASGVAYYGIEALAVVSSPSWRIAENALVGEGAITALKWDLNAERNAVKLASQQASRGRPDVVLSPKEPGVLIPKPAREEIATAYAEFAAKKGAAFVLSGAMEASWPQYTLRDMEFGEQRKLTRETVLAVFGVPPVRVGLPTANYATANQQERGYWQGLRARAAVMDAAYTRIARMFDPRLTLTHDFSQVPALQESRTERLDRVVQWQNLGATPAAAAAYEGFADAPVADEVATPEPAPKPSTEPTKGLLHLFAVNGGQALAPVAKSLPDDEEGRATLWRGWVDRVHTPTERKVGAGTVRALRRQAARIVSRLETMPVDVGRSVTRDLLGDIMGYLFPAAETTAWTADMKRPILEAVRGGFADGASQLGRGWEMDTTEADIVSDRQLGIMVSQTLPTTQAAVRDAVLAGIEAGEGVNDIGLRIRDLGAFRPARALLIARTETTRSLGAGHRAAYARMESTEGVVVRQQWLSARDSEVRDAHAFLDGQVRASGELFVIPSGDYAGAKGSGPGGFDDPALVCNCRCTTVPLVEVA